MQLHGNLRLFGVCALYGAAIYSSTATAADKPSEKLEEVVVTGSRVITNGNDSPTPVTVVTAQQLMEAHPGTVAEALNDLPSFSQTRGQFTNPGSGGGGANNAAE